LTLPYAGVTRIRFQGCVLSHPERLDGTPNVGWKLAENRV
jgi:hypothetical protein